MYKCFFILYLLSSTIPAFAKCSQVSESIRNVYASDFYAAFVTQSYGESTLAFFQFDCAREQAKKAGESPLRIAAVEQLFGWYRMYGSSLKLFYKKPTGNDRIHGEFPLFSNHVSQYESYQSEWGKTPEQAEQIRQFMFGVGEVIAGVFCATISSGGLFHPSSLIALDGTRRMFSALNTVWAQHQAMIALKNWEQNTLKPVSE